MSNHRLSRQEWDTLDNLLGKHGFGGYYDLMETLGMVCNDLGVGNSGIMVEEIKTLPEIIHVLQEWSWKLSREKGFLPLVLLMLEKKEAEK